MKAIQGQLLVLHRTGRGASTPARQITRPMRSTSTVPGARRSQARAAGSPGSRGTSLHDRSVEAGAGGRGLLRSRVRATAPVQPRSTIDGGHGCEKPGGVVRRSGGRGVVGETLDLDSHSGSRQAHASRDVRIRLRGRRQTACRSRTRTAAAFTHRSLAFPQVTKALASSKTGSTIGRNFRGEKVLSTWATVEPIGWKVFVEQPESAAFASVRGKIWRTALLLAAFLAAGIGLSVVARPPSRPPGQADADGGCPHRRGRLRRADRAPPPRRAGWPRRRAERDGGEPAGIGSEPGAKGRGTHAGVAAGARQSFRRRAASSRSRASTRASSWPTCRTSCGRR